MSGCEVWRYLGGSESSGVGVGGVGGGDVSLFHSRIYEQEGEGKRHQCGNMYTLMLLSVLQHHGQLLTAEANDNMH